MVRVIVNADDIGMTAGVTRGIVRATLQGIVTSATFMASMPGSEDAGSQVVAHGLNVGVHLNVTQGRPLMRASAVPSLTDSTGDFRSASELRARLGRGAVPRRELEWEFARQIERTIELGMMPSHLDTHHHMHASITVAQAMHSVAQRYGIRKIRTLRTLETFTPAILGSLEARDQARRAGRAPRDNARMQRAFRTPIALLKPGDGVADWIDMFEALAGCSDSSVFEVICHPAEPDDDLRRLSRFVASREMELAVVTSPELRKAVTDLGIRLISYREL